ncbi:MAG: hypothetical protein VYA51_10425 [Planctomycetota bacterium]|nr:hypothetical protein [Planctomycetota bacterium]MEC9048418.1 hypothetical protein [Planctomycetota bacterium]
MSEVTAQGRSGGASFDWLNPILVREVQQAVNGRVFQLTIWVALIASVVIASVAGSEGVNVASGRSAFEAGLVTLTPLLLFVIPMQAYSSMRTELKGGVVEQVLMSRLGPGRVISGKLQAAMVQFVLYVSLLMPLLATSYLLRGVDLPTIGVSLFFALAACATATVFAISSAAQGVIPSLQPIANLGMAFGLGVATLGTMGAIGSGAYHQLVAMMLRDGDATLAMSAITLGAGVTATMSWLTARSYLLHAFEDKSSAFRAFLWLLPLLVYGWMFCFVARGDWRELFILLTLGLLLAGLAFGVFMVTEQRDLSPRVRSHVPASVMAAVVCSPLLPGRDRGSLCYAVYSAVISGIAYAFWPREDDRLGLISAAAQVGVMIVAYGLLYLCAGRWLRGRLPETVQGSQAGRVALPLLLFACIVVPLLVDGLSHGYVSAWHLGHVLNPFWTTAYVVDEGRWDAAQPWVLAAIGVVLAAQLPGWIRGVREVLRASAARRSR